VEPLNANDVTLARPSKFWEKLAAYHTQELDKAGLERMKRHQALHYFTWRWGWAPRNKQVQFLMTHTSPLAWLRAAAERVDLSDSLWHDVTWSRSERWIYTIMIRLLWNYARRHDRVQATALAEPTLGDPLPAYSHGRLISQDLANSALEVSAIARALSGRRPHSILEVGAGYGRTAYVLLNIFPECHYTIVDIEPALSISRWYLSSLFPADRLTFVSPNELGSLPASAFDLALSISSLQEMTPAQVAAYLSFFDRAGSPGTVYLKQWHRWHNAEDNVTLPFADYPIPGRWQRIFRHRAPVQTNFEEAAWAVPPLPSAAGVN
jgi:putative sugar O-methyltransferase